jgi:hypothetical protein
MGVLTPQARSFEERSDVLSRKLIRIGIGQRNMVTVKVADNYIGAVLQGALDFLTNPFANRYLKRMGKKFVTLIAQRNSRINDYFAVSGFH